jgi:biopolymer transport protein ExbD
MRPRAKARSPREPAIALINIVFLMLIFFMVAGTLARPPDPALKLVETRALEGRAPEGALVVYPDGRMVFDGQDQPDAATFLAGLTPQDRAIVRLVPDRALPAAALVTLARDLRAAGAGRVLLVTQRALE